MDPEAVAAFVDKFLAPVDPLPEEGVLPFTGGAIPAVESGAAASPGLSQEHAQGMGVGGMIVLMIFVGILAYVLRKCYELNN